MEDEQQGAQQKSPLDPAVLELQERLPEPLARLASVQLQVLVDVADLLADVHVGRLEVPHPAEHLHGLLAPALGEQPARGLGDPQGPEEEDPRGDQLHREGDEPLRPVLRQRPVDAVVDPEADQAADLPAQLVDPDEPAPHRGGRELGDVDRRHVRRAADAHPGQHAAGEDEAEAALPRRAQHHGRADYEDDAEDEEGPAPPQEVAGAVGEQAAEEGAGLVHGDDVGLQQGQVVRFVALELKLLGEGGQRERRADER